MNLIKYLGGIEAVEMAIDLQLRHLLRPVDSGENGVVVWPMNDHFPNDPMRAIRFSVVDRVVTRPDMPNTGERVPQYYRRLEGTTHMVVEGIVRNTKNGGNAQFFLFHEREALLGIQASHDAMLNKITVNVLQRICNEANQKLNIVYHDQRRGKVDYNYPDVGKKFTANTVGPDESYSVKVKFLLRSLVVNQALPKSVRILNRAFAQFANTKDIKELAALDSYYRSEIVDKETRKTFFIGLRMIRPLLWRGAAQHDAPDGTKAPSGDWWERVLYFSNHGDRQLMEAMERAEFEPVLNKVANNKGGLTPMFDGAPVGMPARFTTRSRTRVISQEFVDAYRNSVSNFPPNFPTETLPQGGVSNDVPIL